MPEKWGPGGSGRAAGVRLLISGKLPPSPKATRAQHQMSAGTHPAVLPADNREPGGTHPPGAGEFSDSWCVARLLYWGPRGGPRKFVWAGRPTRLSSPPLSTTVLPALC